MADESGPGWNAIDAALTRLYGAKNDWRYAPDAPRSAGSLAEIRVYEVANHQPHWHFVTLGFSELFQKETDDSDTSGYGFELTLRAARHASENEPPSWPLALLRHFGLVVFQTGCGFFPLQAMNLHGPVAAGSTQLTCAAFAIDHDLAHLETPNGRLTFLQVIPLQEDELQATRDWSTTGVLELLMRSSPRLVTHLDRPSVFSNSSTEAELKKHIADEGSLQEIEFVSLARWLKRGANLRVTLGADCVPGVIRALARRLPYGRSFLIAGQESSIALEPAESDGWRMKGELLVISLSPRTAAEMRIALKPCAGEYAWPSMPGFQLEIDSTNPSYANENRPPERL